MRRFTFGFLCAVLAGCSSPAVSTPGQSMQSTQSRVHATFAQPYDGSPLIYASDAGNQVVWIAAQSGKKQKAIGKISGFSAPKGLTVDSSGNLYVGDVTGDGGHIYEFAPGTSSPSRTLTGVATPYSIAVDVNGNVYSDCVANSNCTENAIYVFAAGATSPTSTIVDANFTEINNIAVDAAGDLFLDGDEPGFPVEADEIDEIPAGSNSPVILSSTIDEPNALTLDAKQNLIVAQANGEYINVYAPPYTGAPNKKKYLTNCKTHALALNANDSALWYDCNDQAYQLSYPGLKPVESTAKLTRWGLDGLATDPASSL